VTGTEIAAVIAAATGGAVALFGGIRNLWGDKAEREATAAANLLKGYDSQVGRLQEEIHELEARHDRQREEWKQERDRLRAEHAAELRRVREEHREEIARMREQHAAEIVRLNERIDELGSQVYALQNRPPDTRQRRSDG
jgi:predicted RNase H-like nuclease (RuvC/YqgF family)